MTKTNGLARVGVVGAMVLFAVATVTGTESALAHGSSVL